MCSLSLVEVSNSYSCNDFLCLSCWGEISAELCAEAASAACAGWLKPSSETSGWISICSSSGPGWRGLRPRCADGSCHGTAAVPAHCFKPRLTGSDGGRGQQEGLGTEPAAERPQCTVHLRWGGRDPSVSGPITAAVLLVQCMLVWRVFNELSYLLQQVGVSNAS